MKDYLPLELSQAYQLLNPGSLIWVSTLGEAGQPDIAPIAWSCPLDYEPSTRVLFVCDRGHETLKNIIHSSLFVIAIPHADQRDLVVSTGSVSGRDCNKFSRFGIASRSGTVIDELVPEDCIAWLECETLQLVDVGSVCVVMGSAVYAAVDRSAWNGGLLVENPAGRLLHHAGSGRFYVPGALLKA